MKNGWLKSVLWCALGGLWAHTAHAELLNISTNAVLSQNTSTSACTIVGSGGKTLPDGTKVFVVLAEGKAIDSNPTIAINFNEGTILTNGDWNDVTSASYGRTWRNNIKSWLGRNPGRDSDAGSVFSVGPGGWFCVTAREVSGGDTLRPVAISITDVTSADSTAKSQAMSATVGGGAGVVVHAPPY